MNISFFIPAYNCGQTIAESVDSIMETNFFDGDELIITNDCSTDDTATVLETLQTKYPVIKVINHNRNKGGAAARNTAVETACHNLLFCLDSDNVLAPLSITQLKDSLIKNDADVAVFQYQHFFTNDMQKPVYTWSLPEGKFEIEGYLTGKNTPGQHGNYMFTKQSWVNAKGYAEGCPLDTWTFGLRQALTGATTVVLKDTYYYHRLVEHSYWMRELEAKLWTVSMNATYALFPFFDIIDEKFLKYMLGAGRYKWFYTLKKKPLKLVNKGAKDTFYALMHKKMVKYIYPKTSLAMRAINKIKKVYRNNDSR